MQCINKLYLYILVLVVHLFTFWDTPHRTCSALMNRHEKQITKYAIIHFLGLGVWAWWYGHCHRKYNVITGVCTKTVFYSGSGYISYLIRLKEMVNERQEIGNRDGERKYDRHILIMRDNMTFRQRIQVSLFTQSFLYEFSNVRKTVIQYKFKENTYQLAAKLAVVWTPVKYELDV